MWLVTLVNWLGNFGYLSPKYVESGKATIGHGVMRQRSLKKFADTRFNGEWNMKELFRNCMH